MNWDVFDPAADYTKALQVVVHRFERHEIRTRFDVRALRELRVVVREGERRIVEMAAYVWSQKFQDETATLSVKYPASLWQGFKQRRFPRWALRRWPVRYTTVTETHRFQTVALFPGFKRPVIDGAGEAVLRTFVNLTSHHEETEP